MTKVLCFGELLLRYSPELNGEWIRKNNITVYIGGAELNTASALAKWNIPVSYITALPSHTLASEIVEEVEKRNIDCSRLLYSGERIGSYFLPQGADLKNSGVIYDRKHSAFWNLKRGEINWDEVLKDITWFHFSAINPALNEEMAMICKEALEAARRKNCIISTDLNYREKLWQYGKDPRAIMSSLVQYCDLVMGNIWAAEKMLGIEISEDVETKESQLMQSEKTAAAIMNSFPRCKTVAHTFRFEDGNGIRYFASLHNNKSQFVSQEMTANAIVDKVGSGDTFMAGLIYGSIQNLPSQEMVNFAAAAAFDKLFIKGDSTTSGVEAIMKGIKNYA